jgi:hypothetical protein
VEAFFSINIAWKHYDKYALDPLNEAAEVSYLYKKKVQRGAYKYYSITGELS